MIHREAGERNTTFQNATYRDMPIRLAVLDRLIAHPQLSGWVRIVVAQTREERESLARGILTNAFLPIALAVLAGGGLIWFGVRQALAPLASLERLIRARQPNDFRPIDIPPPAEVSQLVHAINSLLTRLHGNLDTMQTFLADAAHQIRTPLASLRLQAELAADEDDPESLRRSVGRIHRNAVEASQLTSQLLSHAMVIHRSEALEPETIDLAALLDHVVQRARPICDDVLIHLDIDEAAEHGVIAGDPISLTEAMTNLVDNAVKYAGRAVRSRSASAFAPTATASGSTWPIADPASRTGRRTRCCNASGAAAPERGPWAAALVSPSSRRLPMPMAASCPCSTGPAAA